MTSRDERRELRAVVRSLLDRSASSGTTREHMAGEAFDRDLWATMATEIGLHGLAIPERWGGAGAGWTEQSIVFEELGRTLACVPYLSTICLAGSALLAAEESAAERWLPSIADGTLTATLAYDRPATRPGPGTASRVSAVSAAAGWRLDGRLTHVLDGHSAGLVLVAARSDQGIGVFALEGEPAVEAVETSDQTRRTAHLTLSSTPATRIGGPEVLDAALRTATAMLASEQTGGAAACLAQSVDHATTRHQFGRPIGSFQAVQHHCADMLVAVESSRSAAARAAAQRDLPAEPEDVSDLLAGATCSEAYAFCASTNVQVHGGIGYTWEHDAHLHVKRSRGSMVLFGTPVEQRRALAATGVLEGRR